MSLGNELRALSRAVRAQSFHEMLGDAIECLTLKATEGKSSLSVLELLLYLTSRKRHHNIKTNDLLLALQKKAIQVDNSGEYLYWDDDEK